MDVEEMGTEVASGLDEVLGEGSEVDLAPRSISPSAMAGMAAIAIMAALAVIVGAWLMDPRRGARRRAGIRRRLGVDGPRIRRDPTGGPGADDEMVAVPIEAGLDHLEEVLDETSTDWQEGTAQLADEVDAAAAEAGDK